MTIEANYLLQQDKGESYLEEYMSNLLITYEIYTMCRSIRQQVWMLGHKYRADFILDVNGRNKIILEVDGRQHFKDNSSVEYWYKRHKDLEKLGYIVIHFVAEEIFKYPEYVATQIESIIEALKDS